MIFLRLSHINIIILLKNNDLSILKMTISSKMTVKSIFPIDNHESEEIIFSCPIQSDS